jgi:hypothetical protein
MINEHVSPLVYRGVTLQAEGHALLEALLATS